MKHKLHNAFCGFYLVFLIIGLLLTGEALSERGYGLSRLLTPEGARWGQQCSIAIGIQTNELHILSGRLPAAKITDNSRLVLYPEDDPNDPRLRASDFPYTFTVQDCQGVRLWFARTATAYAADFDQ